MIESAHRMVGLFILVQAVKHKYLFV